MAEEKITPEERLLKIIENPKELQKQRIPLALKSAAVKAVVRKWWFDIKRIDKKAILKQFNLTFVSRVVFGFCIIFTIGCIIGFIRTQSRLNNGFIKVLKGLDVEEAASSGKSSYELNINDIIRQAAKRNIFTLLPSAAQPQGAVDPAAAVSNFKLVGIMWSENPQVMIEDVKMQKTYLLNAGERMGDFTIKNIFREKVIITKDSQEWELR